MLIYYLRMGVIMCFLIFLIMALLEPRFSNRKTLVLTAIFTALSVGGNAVLMGAVGYERFAQFMPLVVTAPYLILYFYLYKYRDWKPVFSLLTVVSFGLAAMGLSGVISNAFFGQAVWADLLVRLVLFVPIGAFVLLVFRRPYLDMLTIMKHGWLVLCTFPLLFFAAFYFLAAYPDILHNRPDDYVPLVCVIAMLFSIYGIIVVFFRYVRNTVGEKEDRLLVEAQAAALRDQLDFIRQADMRSEIQRHDLAHGVEGAATLLREGKSAEALELLMQLQAGASQPGSVRYCENETMNALLTVYLEKAGQEDIRVEHQLYVPSELPVDAAELSTVFANALGNAIRLCRGVEPENRLLEITFLFDRPKTQTAFEIACPIRGQFVLNGAKGEKRPVTATGPLAVGYRGIEAFARRHDALYSCKITDGRFYLRMVIDGSDRGANA